MCGNDVDTVLDSSRYAKGLGRCATKVLGKFLWIWGERKGEDC